MMKHHTSHAVHVQLSVIMYHLIKIYAWISRSPFEESKVRATG